MMKMDISAQYVKTRNQVFSGLHFKHIKDPHTALTAGGVISSLRGANVNNSSTKYRVDYKTYLKSMAWKKKKNDWIDSGRPLECWACGKLMPANRSGFNFHHRTYKNLGHERLDDLVLLCMADHQQLSKDWEFSRKVTGHCLRNETHMYIVLNREIRGLSTKKDNRVMKYLGAFCE